MWKKTLFLATFTGGCSIYFWSKDRFVSRIEVTRNKENSNENGEISSYIYLPENTGYFCEPLEAVESSWIPRRKNTSLYWKLLMLSKSKDRAVRHKAVKALSELPKLEKWQYKMIAQACDARTSIALARTLKADESFFLSPPFKDLEEGNLSGELLRLFFSMPNLDSDSCHQNLLRQIKAASVLKNDEVQDFEFDYPASIYRSKQKKQTSYEFYKLCLEVFLGLSATESYRKVLFEKGILKMLLKILKTDEENRCFQSLIAQILANFALEEKYTNIIYISGWIGILARWAKSSYVEVNLPAAKALVNLDRDDYHYTPYDDGVYLLHPLRKSQEMPCADVIFVHGLLGATFWTWRQNNSEKMNSNSSEVEEPLSITKESQNVNKRFNPQSYTRCWPKDWLAVDFPNIRLISVDYKTRVSNWRAKCPQMEEKDSLEVKAKTLMQKLLFSNVGERPIIWVAHSMGGILVKQMLVEAAASKEDKTKLISDKTVGVVFYSVPHKGSEVANIFHTAPLIFQPSIDIGQLQKGSAKLLSLNDQFKKLALENKIATLSFAETKKTCWGLYWTVLVPPDSSDPGFGEFVILQDDHLSTCKPSSPESVIYSKVSDFLIANILVVPANVLHPCHFSDSVIEISKIMCLIP